MVCDKNPLYALVKGQQRKRFFGLVFVWVHYSVGRDFGGIADVMA